MGMTDADQAAAARAIELAVRSWRTDESWEGPTGVVVRQAARVGARALGCTIHDLRDSEVEWLQATARTLLAVESL